MIKVLNMLERILLIDGNHLIYRAHFKFSGLRTLDEKPTDVIYGAPYILESIIRRFGPDKVIVIFDSKRSEFRKSLLPNYKERESKLGEDKESFYFQRSELIKLLTYLGLMVYQVEGYEADDVITYLSQLYYKKGWETIIVSADKDFVQLINKSIFLYNVNKGLMVDPFNCKIVYGYTPKQCVDYLSLMGDHSDNIPGYPGIGEKRALQFLTQFSSIKKYLKDPKKFGKVDKDKMVTVYERNKKLIDLMYFLRKVLKPEEMVPVNEKPVMDIVSLKCICADYQINSFLKIQFLKTYQDLYNGK